MQQIQNFNSTLNPETDSSSVEAIQQWLISQLSDLLSVDVETIDAQQPLTRYGLDSIDAVTVVGDLEDWLDLELPSTLFWDYPTIEKAVNYLVKEFEVSL